MYAEQAGNKGDFLNKAIENLRLALKADPNAGFISEELSDLYVQSGRLREAALDAEEALRTNPNDLNARRILGRIYTRMIGDSSGKVDETIAESNRTIHEDCRDSAQGSGYLADARPPAQDGPELRRSGKGVQEVLEIDPNNEDALHRAGNRLCRPRQHPRSLPTSCGA